MRDPGAVGRPDPLPAQHLPVGAQPRTLAHSRRRERDELGLAGFGRKRKQRLAVGEELRVAVANSRRTARFDESAGSDRCHEHLPVGGQGDARSVGCEVGRRQVVGGRLHPPLARLIEVGGQTDRHRGVRVLRDVVDPDVRAELVGDPSVGDRRGQHVPPRVARVLLQVAPRSVHRPDIHGAVAVGGEVDASLKDHRRAAGSGEIGGEVHGFVFLFAGPGPNGLGRSSLVALGLAPLRREAREVNAAAVRGERGIVCLSQREQLGHGR